MIRNAITGRKYKNEKFTRKQEATEDQRRELAKVLGIPGVSDIKGQEGNEKYIEIGVKNLNEDAAELATIKDLSIVHFVALPEDSDIAEIVKVARGVVLHQKKDVVIQSIPTPDNLHYDKLVRATTDEGEETVIVKLRNGNEIMFHPETLSIKEYIDGTYIRFVKFHGKTRIITSRNLMPEGIRKYGEQGEEGWIHGPSRWGTKNEPFIDAVHRIIIESGHEYLLEEGYLFPKSCEWSNVSYDFVLADVSVTRIYSGILGKGGLIYIGHKIHWNNNRPPPSIENKIGVPHATERISRINGNYNPLHFPATVSDEERIQQCWIINSEKISFDKADAILKGRKSPYAELSGGGKLVVSGKIITRRGISKDIKTVHIESTAWKHRTLVIGNNDSQYNQFLLCINDKDNDPNKITAAAFEHKYKLIKIPDAVTIMEAVSKQAPLPVIKDKRTNIIGIVKNESIDLIWYNYLLCTNPSYRLAVLEFPDQYNKDIRFAAKWLEKGALTDLSKKIMADEHPTWASFLDRMRNAYRGSNTYEDPVSDPERDSIVILLQGSRGDASKLIQISRRISRMESGIDSDVKSIRGKPKREEILDPFGIQEPEDLEENVPVDNGEF